MHCDTTYIYAMAMYDLLEGQRWKDACIGSYNARASLPCPSRHMMALNEGTLIRGKNVSDVKNVDIWFVFHTLKGTRIKANIYGSYVFMLEPYILRLWWSGTYVLIRTKQIDWQTTLRL